MELNSASSIPRRRSTQWWIIAAGIIAGLVGLLFCLIVGVGILSLLGKRVEPSVVTATDGQSQLTVPDSWKVRTDLNDVAEIQVANLIQEQYMIVLTENKADFDDVDLDQYADLTLEIALETIVVDEIPAAKSVTINGKRAIQYELHGTVDNMNVVYWITNVEGSHNYYQLLAWTLASKAEQNAPILHQVMHTFQEVVK